LKEIPLKDRARRLSCHVGSVARSSFVATFGQGSIAGSLGSGVMFFFSKATFTFSKASSKVIISYASGRA
jgi:hypothetical protein